MHHFDAQQKVVSLLLGNLYYL